MLFEHAHTQNCEVIKSNNDTEKTECWEFLTDIECERNPYGYRVLRKISDA